MNWQKSKSTIKFADGGEITVETEVGDLASRTGQALRASVNGPMMHVSFGPGAILSLGCARGQNERTKFAARIAIIIAGILERDPAAKVEVFGSDWTNRRTITSITTEGNVERPEESNDSTTSEWSPCNIMADSGIRASII